MLQRQQKSRFKDKFVSGRKYHNEFVDYVTDILEQLEEISVRQMFGGFGIYKNGLMFALIADNELYFKADENAAKFFQTYGSTQFTYQNSSKNVKMSYWKVVPEIFDDQDMIKIWIDLAYNVAIKNKKKPKSPRAKI